MKYIRMVWCKQGSCTCINDVLVMHGAMDNVMDGSWDGWFMNGDQQSAIVILVKGVSSTLRDFQKLTIIHSNVNARYLLWVSRVNHQNAPLPRIRHTHTHTIQTPWQLSIKYRNNFINICAGHSFITYKMLCDAMYDYCLGWINSFSPIMNM